MPNIRHVKHNWTSESTIILMEFLFLCTSRIVLQGIVVFRIYHLCNKFEEQYVGAGKRACDIGFTEVHNLRSKFTDNTSTKLESYQNLMTGKINSYR